MKKAPAVRQGLSGTSSIAAAQATAKDQAAASLSFLSGRTLTLTEAGLAANQRSSPVNGSLPLRFGFAATATEVIFSRPGSVNVPAPFLWTDAEIAPSSEARTAFTLLLSTPLCSTMCETSDDFDSGSLIGLRAAGAFAALAGALAAAFFAAVLVVLAMVILVTLIE